MSQGVFSACRNTFATSLRPLNVSTITLKSMSEVEFMGDRKTQDAVIRNFEIIGEASRNIERHHPIFANEHSYLPFGFAYEMRNALSHGYFKVDLEIV